MIISLTIRRSLVVMLAIVLTMSFTACAVPVLHTETAPPDGTVRSWGFNAYGQLGNGTNTNSNTPVQVSMPRGVVVTAIADGWDHSLTLTSGGKVWAWGLNDGGQLGNGTNTNSNTPVQVSMPRGVVVTAIAAGGYDSLALTSDGKIWAWGYNNEGQLGNGTYTNNNTPVQVSMPRGVVVTAIAGGWDHNLALTSDGKVWAWGYNNEGQLGNGTNTNSNIPVQVNIPSGVTVIAVSGGLKYNLALTSDGTVWAWGYNNGGQLGNGTNTNSNIPVQVSMPSGVTVNAIVAGGYHGLALTSDGTAWAWGFNGQGELGNGTNTNSNTPVKVSMPSGVTVNTIAAGGWYSLALTSGGTVWAWGYNVHGELGNGTYTNSNAPVQVSMPSGVTVNTIATGGYHTLALILTLSKARVADFH